MDGKMNTQTNVFAMVATWGVVGLGAALIVAMLLMFADVGPTGAVFLAGCIAVPVGLFVAHRMSEPLPPPGANHASTAQMARSVTAPAAAAPAPATPAAAPAVTASSPLPGQAELAERKGSWKYEGGASAPADAAPAGTDIPDAAPAGTRPAGLDAARDGTADDLKQIKGIGPKLADMLNEMGYYHFDQIAAWTEDEIAWIDENLEGFKGRVSRDDWVSQAKELAKAG